MMLPTQMLNNVLYQKDIFLSGDIDDSSVKLIIDKINEFNHNDDMGDLYKAFDRNDRPIMLYINSFGGSVYDGLALYDTIANSRTPIITVATGSAMSMGFIIFLAGHKRTMTKHATLMYHQVAKFMGGVLKDLEESLEEGQRMQEVLNSIVLEKTKIPRSVLDDVCNRKGELYMSHDKAIEYGILTEAY